MRLFSTQTVKKSESAKGAHPKAVFWPLGFTQGPKTKSLAAVGDPQIPSFGTQDTKNEVRKMGFLRRAKVRLTIVFTMPNASLEDSQKHLFLKVCGTQEIVFHEAPRRHRVP